MIKPAAAFEQWGAKLKVLYPAALSHTAEQQSFHGITLNSRNWRDSKWQRDAQNRAPRHALRSHVKRAINMHKFTWGHVHPCTCRWCRRSPCRSHSSQCPVPSCRNVFCWKAQKWHIRGKRVTLCVCMCMWACKDIFSLSFLSVGVNFWHTHPCEYRYILSEITPDHFLMNDSRSNRLRLLRKPWVTIFLRA